VIIASLPPIAATLTEVARPVDRRQSKPVASFVLPREDTRRTHTLIEGRHAPGKIGLRVVP
jgi:hypothetical protein